MTGLFFGFIFWFYFIIKKSLIKIHYVDFTNMLILQKSFFKTADDQRIQSIHLVSPANQVTPSDLVTTIDISPMELDDTKGIVIPGSPSFLTSAILPKVEKFPWVASGDPRFGAVIVRSSDPLMPVGAILQKASIP